MFETLAELGDLCPAPTTKRFHFTMVDIKATVIARDLVMFYILRALSRFSLDQMQHDVAAIEVCPFPFPFVAFIHNIFIYRSKEERKGKEVCGKCEILLSRGVTL